MVDWVALAFDSIMYIYSNTWFIYLPFMGLAYILVQADKACRGLF